MHEDEKLRLGDWIAIAAVAFLFATLIVQLLR